MQTVSADNSAEQAPLAAKSMRNAYLILGVLLLLLLSLALLFPFAWQSWVNWRYEDSLYTVETVPHQRVAIVFGARVYTSGRLSAMLRDRVDTAVDLYHAGKVDKLLLTGDNSSVYYDEPGAMMAHAISSGVEPDRHPAGLWRQAHLRLLLSRQARLPGDRRHSGHAGLSPASCALCSVRTSAWKASASLPIAGSTTRGPSPGPRCARCPPWSSR